MGRLLREFDIMAAEVDEALPDGVHPRQGVGILALRKGAAVAAVYPDCIVISSDTLVELNGVPLGKPAGREEAVEMLRSLSGRVHNVHTGIAVHYRGAAFCDVATTSVSFREIGEEELFAYVDGGEPMDKAGAYGIQGEGGKFVSRIDGEFDTVVGLSVKMTDGLIRRALAETGESELPGGYNND